MFSRVCASRSLKPEAPGLLGSESLRAAMYAKPRCDKVCSQSEVSAFDEFAQVVKLLQQSCYAFEGWSPTACSSVITDDFALFNGSSAMSTHPTV